MSTFSLFQTCRTKDYVLISDIGTPPERFNPPCVDNCVHVYLICWQVLVYSRSSDAQNKNQITCIQVNFHTKQLDCVL